MKISVIGGGYVGTVTGVCLADLGNNVTIVEIDSQKITMINNKIPPLFEQGLEDLLKKNGDRVTATKDLYSAVMNSDICFICVGTPSKADGSIDLSYIENAAAGIGSALKDKQGYMTVVVKSTVLPGTCNSIVAPVIMKNSGKKSSNDFCVCSNPEFLREGRAVFDFKNPDRIVIGSEDPLGTAVIRDLYSGFDCPVIECSTATAEMIKYVSNAFLALKISYANQIGNLAKVMGIDSYSVFEGVGLDKRIGPFFFNAGLGFGGSCFPKDVIALQRFGESMGVKMSLLDTALAVNREQPAIAISLLEHHLTLRDKRIGILGLAFKPDTDDIREAKSIDIVTQLLAKGADVIAYDPMAIDNFRQIFPMIRYVSSPQKVIEGSDAVIIVTEWKDFKDLDYLGKIVIDGRRIMESKNTAGIYEGVCW